MTDTSNVRDAAFAADATTPNPVAIVVAAPYAAEGPLISGTSSTTNPIDTLHNLNFAINEFNRSFNPGTRIRATAVGFTNVWQEGIVTAWDGQTLTLDADLSSGTGIYSSWQINVAGQPGQQGLTGPVGPQGPASGPVGPVGPAGPPGSVWRNGSGPPPNSLGVNGDYYLDDNTDNVWLRSGGFYAVVANIQGAQGVQGIQGIQGPQGIIPEAPTDGGYYARRNAAWESPPGGGNVSSVGTPTAGQLAQWTSPNTIAGIASSSFAPILSPAFVGTPTAPSPPTADNSTAIATTQFVKNQNYAPLASPILTGTPQAPTPPPGDNSPNLATTAFVAQAGAFTTGDLKPTHKTVADSGWIFWVDGTIGDASSGAGVRANADTQALFTLYYTGYTDANCPLLTSSGGSTTRSAQGTAAAAYAAHCRMTLPAGSSRVLGIAGSGSGLTARAIGSKAGQETFAMSTNELVQHNHIVKGDYALVENYANSTQSYGINVPNDNTGLTGQNVPFTLMQPSTFINVMIRL